MNWETIIPAAIAFAALMAIAFAQGKRAGFKEGHTCGHFNGHREGYGQGYKCGEANGWQKRHFEEIERDKAINAKRLATIAAKKNA